MLYWLQVVGTLTKLSMTFEEFTVQKKKLRLFNWQPTIVKVEKENFKNSTFNICLDALTFSFGIYLYCFIWLNLGLLLHGMVFSCFIIASMDFMYDSFLCKWDTKITSICILVQITYLVDCLYHVNIRWLGKAPSIHMITN